MSFELKVSKDFVEMSDAMIASLFEKKTTQENGNVLLLKVPLLNSSTIAIVEGKYHQDQVYQAGFARVLGCPRLLDANTDAKIKVGDYVIFSHAAKYTISNLVVQWLFGVKLADNKPIDFVEEYNSSPVIMITDRDVLTVIPEESVHAVLA
jgi:hypothetical protein